MKRTINLPVLLIIAIFVLQSCGDEKPRTEKKKFSFQKNTEQQPLEKPKESNPNVFIIGSKQFDELNMQLGYAGMKTVDNTVTAAGYVEVPRDGKAEVSSYLGGYLKSTSLLPGDYVKKGQRLISLENLEFIQLQQDYLKSSDQLAYLKTVYDRKKTLAEEKITSQDSKQQAESEYNIALSNYEGLRKMLQLINIDPDRLSPNNISSSINLYAPIDGFITTVNAVEGMFVEPTDIIFEIINTSHLHIELEVYEKDILKIKVGQKVLIRIPGSQTESFDGEVLLVGKSIDSEDRTVSVHCHFDNGDFRVMAGMYVEAEIIVATEDRYCLPVEAFVREDDEYFVFVVDHISDEEYAFEKIKTDVGLVNEDCIEIVGLSQKQLDGKQVLIKGAFDM